MRIGLCTGGGDCPGLNAAIRAVVKCASQKSNIKILGIKDSYLGLQATPPNYVELNQSHVIDIYGRGGTILGTYNKGLSATQHDIKSSIHTICENYKKLNLDCLIVIGGEGTQSIAQLLVEAGLNIIGIPKTIDNDLPGTEQTIGFSTCVDLVSDSVTKLQSTAESHDRIMILEVMGRDSGYIGLYGGLAGGAHIILIPEIPFDYNAIIAKLEERKKNARHHSVIVVSEGALEKNNSTTRKYKEFSISQTIAKKISTSTRMETRVTVLGHLQRGDSPNPTDRLLATRLGIKAMDLTLKKNFGHLAVVKDGTIQAIPYNQIKKWQRRLIDKQDEHLIAAEAIGICLGR